MSPSDAIRELLALPNWTEARIAAEAGTSQPNVNRIKHGASPAYDIGAAIVALAAQNRARNSTPTKQRRAG